MLQLLFAWAVVNMVVSIANVVNLIRLKREWKKAKKTEVGDKDWDMAIDLLG